MASGPITSWEIDGETVETVSDFIFGGLKNPPGDLPHPGIEPGSLTSLALAGGFFTSRATWEAPSGLFSATQMLV